MGRAMVGAHHSTVCMPRGARHCVCAIEANAAPPSGWQRCPSGCPGQPHARVVEWYASPTQSLVKVAAAGRSLAWQEGGREGGSKVLLCISSARVSRHFQCEWMMCPWPLHLPCALEGLSVRSSPVEAYHVL